MASKKTFHFKLGDVVKLVQSGETGTVIGRAHHLESDPSYHVRYKAADGRLVEGWWAEAALMPA